MDEQQTEEHTGANVQVSWEEARETNLKNWNDRVPIHVASGYNIAGFTVDATNTSEVVRYDLPFLEPHLEGQTVAGKTLCHLQCHIGTDTLSFARFGARVTGVDFSQPALDAAQDLTAAVGQSARWVHTDVLDAAQAVGEQFDVVYTSIGTITWLNDLDRWAAQIHGLLVDGGIFYIRDGHPLLFTLDESVYPPVPRYRYFANGLAEEWKDEGTYAGEGTVTHTRTLEFPHSISEVLTALIKAGLRIEAFHEGDTLPWEFSTHMERTETGDYRWPAALRESIPCTFTVVARKP